MSDKVHAELGASGAERWIACPGSINLSRGLPDFTTDYSREGTAAHNLAEQALEQNRSPLDYIGETVSDGEGAFIVVDEEMAEAVKTFTDLVRGRSEHTPPTVFGIEARFDLSPLDPPAPMFGTTDHWAYYAQSRTLYIDDYKHGQGVVKEAIENEQLMYYGIGGLLILGALPGQHPVEKVVLTIVQPRAHHPDGPIRSWSTTPAELLDFVGVLFAAAEATLKPDAPLVPGGHCKFCKAAGICPAKKAEAQALAQIEFEVLPEHLPPPPATLPIEELADMATKFYILKDWMKQGEALIEAKLRAGEEVPGWKLVEGKKVRSWADAEATEQFLRSEGYEPEEYHTSPVLKSPAQIEKLVGKKNLPKDLVVSKSSGLRVARESDRRPAVSGGMDLPALPPGPTSQQEE